MLHHWQESEAGNSEQGRVVGLDGPGEPLGDSGRMCFAYWKLVSFIYSME